MDVWTNNYNKDFLIWGANLDIQFALNSYAAAMYIAEYIVKDQVGVSKVMREAAKKAKEGNATLAEMLKAVADSFINFSYMSAQEAVNYVFGYPYFAKSDVVLSINTNPIEKRAKLMISQKDLRKLHEADPDSTEIYHENSLDRYKIRPSRLANMCFADYIATINVTKIKGNKITKDLPNDDENKSDFESEDEIDEFHKFSANGFQYSLRKKPKCLRWLGYRENQDSYNFYRENVMLFLPWRDESKEVENSNPEAVYQEHIQTIQTNKAKYVNYNLNEFEQALDEVEKNMKEAHDEEENEANADALSKSQEITVDWPDDDTKKGDKGQTVKLVKEREDIKYEDLEQSMQLLNTKQRQIVMHLLKNLKLGV